MDISKKIDELKDKAEDFFKGDSDTENKEETKEEKKEEGSGIFTVDGKELPKIEGGYTAHNPGGTLGDNRLT